MRLTIKESAKKEPLFPREAEPVYIEDKAQCHDMKKLLQWEKNYNEILRLLDGAENREGMRLLFALAEEGYPEARWLLSDMYLKGQGGLPESFEKAVEWDRRARYAERLFREKLT